MPWYQSVQFPGLRSVGFLSSEAVAQFCSPGSEITNSLLYLGSNRISVRLPSVRSPVSSISLEIGASCLVLLSVGSCVTRGSVQPPLPPLAPEPEPVVVDDQSRLLPLTTESEPTARDVQTRPFLQFPYWLFPLLENRVPQLDIVTNELSELFPLPEGPDLQLAVEEQSESGEDD